MVACSACKPGSVEARIALPIPRQGDPVLGRSFLSERGRPRPQAAYPRLRASPTAERRWRGGPPLAAYLALLRPGFAEPRLLPGARWALTPPFHPYLQLAPKAVCFLWHCPSRVRRPAPRHYLAACPLEPGLSSKGARKHRSRPSGRSCNHVESTGLRGPVQVETRAQNRRMALATPAPTTIRDAQPDPVDALDLSLCCP